MARHRELVAGRATKIVCETADDGRVVATVVAPDRRGLLATLAGALTCCGLTVLEANLFSTTDGIALDVFQASDPFGRVERHGAERVTMALEGALSGELDVADGVAARVRNYRVMGRKPGRAEVDVDLDASDTATVFEVHADDDVGLLYRLADAFLAFDLDVSVAKVTTLAERVVDVFYVRDAHGGKLTDEDTIERVRKALVDAVAEANAAQRAS
jgi:[protein-PII] uridylyltransferase